MANIIPCNCGAPSDECAWRSIRYGVRIYLCDACWQKREESTMEWREFAASCMNCGKQQPNVPADGPIDPWWCPKCEDNYDGPKDGEAWSGGIADNH